MSYLCSDDSDDNCRVSKAESGMELRPYRDQAGPDGLIPANQAGAATTTRIQLWVQD